MTGEGEGRNAPVDGVPGWHLDPDNPGLQRYWDGRNWTEHTAPLMAPTYQPAASAYPGPRPKQPRGRTSPASVVAVVVAVLVPLLHQAWMLLLNRVPSSVMRSIPDPLLDALWLLPAPAIALGLAVWAFMRARRGGEFLVVPAAALVIAGLWMALFGIQWVFIATGIAYFVWFEWLFFSWA